MTVHVDVVLGDVIGTGCFCIGLDILQAGRRIGVRQHHDLGQIACMGGTMVKIPRLKVYIGVYYKYQILYFALCY